jgi:hypothetical protein
MMIRRRRDVAEAAGEAQRVVDLAVSLEARSGSFSPQSIPTKME